MDIEMHPIPPHGPDQEEAVHPDRGFNRMLFSMANEQYENFRRSWIDLMSWQPSPDSGWVQVCQKLPGFRQAVKPGLHPLTRAFWVFIVVLCCVIVFLIIKEGMKRTMGHPLVVSTETEEVEIMDIDFPGFTITIIVTPLDLNILRYRKRIGKNVNVESSILAYCNFERLGFNEKVLTANGSVWNMDDTGAVLQVIDQTCSVKSTFSGLNDVRNPNNNNPNSRIFVSNSYVMDDPDTEAMQGRIIPFLNSATFNCSDAIAGCFLNEESIPCGLLFKKRYSEWGSTCMFNGIPGPVTRKVRSIHTVLAEGEYTSEELNIYRTANLDQDIGQEQPKVTSPIRIPWRQTSPGKMLGLSFIIKDEIVNRACVHGEGDGFMFTVNHPSDEPQIKRFGKSMPFGHEVFISLNPIVLLADGDIKEMDMGRRRCFFSDDSREAELKYYTKYTKNNCFQECIADVVAEKCNCTSLVAPGKQGRALCISYDGMQCAIEEEKKLYDLGMRASCKHCRPNCRQTKYTTSVTSSPLTENHMDIYRYRYPEQLSHNELFSIVHVYFEMDSIQASRRSSRYSIFEQVGLVGGTISMITGLTMLDIIEVVVVIVVVNMAKRNLRQRVCSIEVDWARLIPRWFRSLPQERAELPIVMNRPINAPELPMADQPIIINVQPRSPSPPIHP
ncbi:Pickpocket protein 28 [Folsomia candida]|uniref:Pickpocket protein 28 n=1 Tax=Folsomia candida TaxID=158441 RepID=A0A226DJ32_FOLCA|nr:Pickpocket protein 28 [Folsomia candida]